MPISLPRATFSRTSSHLSRTARPASSSPSQAPHPALLARPTSDAAVSSTPSATPAPSAPATPASSATSLARTLPLPRPPPPSFLTSTPTLVWASFPSKQQKLNKLRFRLSLWLGCVRCGGFSYSSQGQGNNKFVSLNDGSSQSSPVHALQLSIYFFLVATLRTYSQTCMLRLSVLCETRAILFDKSRGPDHFRFCHSHGLTG